MLGCISPKTTMLVLALKEDKKVSRSDCKEVQHNVIQKDSKDQKIKVEGKFLVPKFEF